MCSILSLRKIISARLLYAWKESALFPSVQFNPISFFSDTSILLEPFLYDNNFDHSWVDVASLLFPEAWYKCDSADCALLYMNVLNLTSTASSSPVSCSFVPLLLLFFIEGAQKPIEYGECQMLQLDSYWNFEIWLDWSERFTEDISNAMSWFRQFSSWCHLRSSKFFVFIIL